MNLRDLIPTYSKEANDLYKYKFTVFTPLYNAESTIERVHKSLLKQTFKNFEWLIINDGSTDNSNSVVQHIIKESPLIINYIDNKVNKHKTACFMQAIQEAKGELFLTFDADDECTEKALEIFDAENEKIPEELKLKISAVTCLCVDQFGNKIGTDFPKDPYYSNTFESYVLENIKGEKWGFTKTNVLKGIKYDEAFVSNGFMVVGLIWNVLAKHGFITKYINTELRIYHVGIENSISASTLEKIALGRVIQYTASLNWFSKKFFFKKPVYFLKQLYFLLRASKYLEFKIKDYLKALDSNLIKSMFVILFPFRRFLK